ncbi:MAG: hypothetical protein H7X89_07135 [Rhizobiales bacterium]|nr:hypothetical protein [Hyphomicrobiales bacterium]
MAVGTLGVGLVFITFRETRAGNTIAERQVEAARDATSKQLRAYIGVLKANAFYIGSAAPRVIAEIKNFGLTPAYGVVSMTRLYIDTHQTGFPGKSDKGGTVTFTTEFGIMEPGQERLIWVNLPEDWIKENIEALRAKTHRLFAETRINYTDLDNLSRYRHFCYFLPDLIHRERGGGAMHMPITGHGNVDGWAKFEAGERA